MESLDPEIGKKYFRLTVVSKEPRGYRFACDCGGERIAFLSHVRSGKYQSCGCLRREATMRNVELAHQAVVTHGQTHSPTYKHWKNMLVRCRDQNNECYGAKGIRVCERWNSFENFLNDLGERPAEGYSLDRFPDRDGNYEPGNVRWATQAEQHENRACSVCREQGHDYRTCGRS